MSFLDPSEDRPRGGPARRSAGGRGGGLDQDILIRRIIAGGLGLLVLLALVFGVKACRDSRKERAFKSYVRDVTSLVQQSQQQSEGLFTVLREPGDQGPVDLQNSVNGFRVQAEGLVDRARDLDAPEDLSRGQRYLVEALEFRRDGLAQIARQLPTALGDEGRREAAQRIAGDMQNFLVSDALYSQRVLPALHGPLREEELLGEVQPPTSKFLPDIEWLSTNTVADRLARVRGGGDDGAETAGGLRGMGLGSVTVGGRALTPGTPVQIPAAGDVAFAVQVQNQGESDESNVSVRVTVTGGDRPIELERTVEAIPAGGAETVTLALTRKPPAGQPVTIEVRIEPVEGEKKTDNNEATYPAVFSEG